MVENELKIVKQNEKKESAKSQESSNSILNADANTSAFQELYELTQRKFLFQLTKVCNSMNTQNNYPKLFCIDLIEKHKVEALANIKRLKAKKGAGNEEPEEETVPTAAPVSTRRLTKQNTIQTEFVYCIRPLCEADDGWHLVNSFVVLHDLAPMFCSYLARLIHILKNGNFTNEFSIFGSEQGTELIRNIESQSLNEEKVVYESYKALRTFFIEESERGNIYSFDDFNNDRETASGVSDLQRCELKNHKVLWLCNQHVQKLSAKVLTDSVKLANSTAFNEAVSLILKDLDTIQIQIN